MQHPRFDFGGTQPIAVANGLGVDSTALLVGLMKRGVRPDLNLFADTGARRPL